MPSAYLAVDQGTTNSKALLVDAAGTVLGRGARPVALDLPRPGWFEQDAEAIWDGLLAAMADAMAAAGGPPLAGIAVSVQRESVVAWSRSTGRALSPVIGWQDGRTAGYCDDLAADGADDLVRSVTGLRLDPMFSAPKIHWLLDSVLAQGAPLDDVCVGTIDAFLVWRLTGGAVFATEAGCASRTLLLDLRRLAWSEELLGVFEVPSSVLPEVRRSDAGFGVTVASGPLPAGVPVRAVLGDSHAALYGHGCTQPGSGKATYGTGSSVMAPLASLGGFSTKVSTTLAWQTDSPRYAREGNILASGAAMDAVAGLLGVRGGPELDALAAGAPDSGGLSLVPAFSGLAAPYWDRNAVGLVVGLVRETSPAHLARAAVEAVAHQVCDVVEAIEEGTGPIAELRADGGASRSSLLMQTQADLLGRPVRVSSVAELSALGAVRLAQDADGAGEPVEADAQTAAVYEPRTDDDARLAARHRWREAVGRSLSRGGDRRRR